MIGKYRAVGLASSVPAESPSGAQMIGLMFRVKLPDGSEEDIADQICLKLKDGTLSKNAIETLVKCFGWNPGDPGAFATLDGEGCVAGKEVDLVLDEETFTGTDGKEHTSTKVKWINLPGEVRGLPKSAPPEHLKALQTRYGSMLRAMSGGVPVPPAAGKTKGPPPKGPPKVAPKPPVKEVTPATMEDAWEAVQKTYGEDAAEEAWGKLLGMLNVDQSSATPEQWGKVKAAADDNIPF